MCTIFFMHVLKYIELALNPINALNSIESTIHTVPTVRNVVEVNILGMSVFITLKYCHINNGTDSRNSIAKAISDVTCQIVLWH